MTACKSSVTGPSPEISLKARFPTLPTQAGRVKHVASTTLEQRDEVVVAATLATIVAQLGEERVLAAIAIRIVRRSVT